MRRWATKAVEKPLKIATKLVTPSSAASEEFKKYLADYMADTSKTHEEFDVDGNLLIV